jgi:hypothetical protein
VLRGLIIAAPAAVAAFFDITLAAALAVGFLPVCARPLAPGRSERLRSGVVGVLAAASIFLGGFLAQWPVAAVAALALGGGLVGYAAVELRRPALMVGLLLCLPLMAVGFSYPGTEKVAGLALDIVMGSAWSVLVLLAWPATRLASEPAPSTAAAMPHAPPRFLLTYGWVLGSWAPPALRSGSPSTSSTSAGRRRQRCW